MKVKLTKESKKQITLAQAPMARWLIKAFEGNEDFTVKDCADTAIRAAYDKLVFDIYIHKASAEIARNHRVYNYHNAQSEDLDVWITAIAIVNCVEMIQIGAFLSDIEALILEEKSSAEVCEYMFIRRFKEIS